MRYRAEAEQISGLSYSTEALPGQILEMLVERFSAV